MRPYPSWLAAVLALMAVASARADLGFPDYVKFPPQVVPNPDQALQRDDVAEVEMLVDKAGTAQIFKGRRYARWLTWRPAAGEPKPGYYNGTEGRIYTAMQEVFARSGWQTLREDDNKGRWTMRLQSGGRVVMAEVKMDAPQAQVWLELVEPPGAATAFVVRPPAARPERYTLKDDVPWLPPWPGARRTGETRNNEPLDISEPGRGGEAQLVGQGFDSRDYQAPPALSQLQFIGEYREALLKAGWQVLFPAAEGVRGQGTLVAHYTRDGRDLWARLRYQPGALLSIASADAGADDLAARLARDCHVPLYGVLFDFDKATLKPESDPVLTRAASLMKADAALKAEVQGHTDNVGGDDYNLRLSDARAASVRTWLVQHGIDAARLTSKGYGKTQPIADNGNDAGRARNRRVELARLGCRKPG